MIHRHPQHCHPGNPPLGRGRIASAVHLAILGSALAASAVRAQETPANAGAHDSSAELQEVVVTANRRAQSVMDVPYNITAVGSEQLEHSGASSIDDLTRLVPGLVQTQQGPAQYGSGNNFIIRGLNAESLTGIPLGQEQTVSPVSTYLGNIPVFFPLTLNDIERIEVLRGPQGTLYGSGSAGGTIRFIPNAPILGKYSAELNVSTGYTDHAGHPNADVNGVFNLPIGDTLAVRVVAGYKRLAGFIDQVALVKTSTGGALGSPVESVPGDPNSGLVLSSQHDTNNSDDWFVRTAARWQPTEQLRVDFTYHHQDTKVQDAQAANPYWPGGVIDYSATEFPGSRGPDVLGVPGGGLYPNGGTYIPPGNRYTNTRFVKDANDRQVDVLAIDGTYDLGFASLSSTTSYFDNRVDFLTDNTSFYSNVTNPNGGVPLVALYNFYPRLMVPTVQNRKNTALAEEIRISSTWHEAIDYVGGLYYSVEHSHGILNQYNPGIAAYSAATTQFDANPAYGDLNWSTDRHVSFHDKAIFGELTWHVLPRWQITGGARVFWQSFTNDYIQHLYICGSACGDGVSPDQNLGTSLISQTQPFHNHIFKLNSSFDLTDSAKIYFTYSEGFRRGGANTVPTAGYFASLPKYLSFQPDLAKNYELGVKGSVNRQLTYTVAVYNINWTNFQFEGNTPSALPAVYNGGKARSRGAELELAYKPAAGLLISAGYSYTDARLTSDFQIIDYPQYGLVNGLPPIVGTSGPRGAALPGAPKSSGTLMADYTLALPGRGDWLLDLNASGSYRGPMASTFPSSATFLAEIPSAIFANARIALTYQNRWTVDISGTNLNNALGLSSGIPVGHVGPFSEGVIATPRTISAGVHLRM